MDISSIAIGAIFLVSSYLVWELMKKAPEPEDETDDWWLGRLTRYYYLRARMTPFLILLVGFFFIIYGVIFALRSRNFLWRWLFWTASGGEVRLKEWECVYVDSYKNVGKTIENMEKNGWRLHTYWPINVGRGTDVDHYLLFERGEWVGQADS